MIGVSAATGGIGGRVARRLAASGHAQRLIVRDASRAPRPEGAEVVTIGGYGDDAGMREAFAGVQTLLLVSAREAADRLVQHRRAVDAAADAGVERIVYLSFIGAAADATFTFARDHFHTEQHIRASGVAFTFSRQNLYMDLLPVLAGGDGAIRGPAGDGRVAPVLRDDVADALHAMLTRPGHEGATYELTGPEALTLAEIAVRVSRRDRSQDALRRPDARAGACVARRRAGLAGRRLDLDLHRDRRRRDGRRHRSRQAPDRPRADGRRTLPGRAADAVAQSEKCPRMSVR